MTLLFAAIFSAIGCFKLSRIVLLILLSMALSNALIVTEQGWSVYHYYVGAKYFDEIGYFDLYECTITAAITRRDLYTYDFRFDDPDCLATFTPERYQAFQQDIADSGFYDAALRDKGANMTPALIAISQFLINTGLATPHNVWLFDVLALSAAALILLWAVGWQKAGYALLFMLTFYGTQDRLLGHFVQWLWLAAVIIGVSLIYRKHHSGGFFIGIAAGLMIFPGVLMLKYWRSKHIIVSFTVGIILALVIGLFNSRGFAGYTDFIQNMKLHSSYVHTENCCNIGLRHTLSWSQNGTLDYRNCFGSHTDCEASYNNDMPQLQWLLLLHFIMTTPPGVMFGLLTLSRYYYLILIVIPVWYSEKWARRLLLTNALIIAWMILDSKSGFILSHWLWFFFFMALGMNSVKCLIQTVVTLYRRQKS